MMKVSNQLQVCKDLDLQELYENNCLIIQHNGCNYISILNQDYSISHTYIYLQNFQFAPSKIEKLIYTNNSKFLNQFIKNQSPRIFSTLYQYYEWLSQRANSIRVIDITKFSAFQFEGLDSKSELINISNIISWWRGIYRLVKNFPEQTLLIYNFFNYTLYLLSRNAINISSMSKFNKFFHAKDSNQYLGIDIYDNRCKHIGGGINYYGITQNQPEKWSTFKAETGKVFYKIDFVASYLQLLLYILQLKIQGDIYEYLALQLNMKTDSRQKVKQRVFQILFSNEIKKYRNIDFFNKIYLFSLYLKEQYQNQGYVKSLISQKHIKLQGNNAVNRSKLLNAFIMSLQSQLYIGLLYQLLMFNKNVLMPVIFKYDEIIMQIDVKELLNEIPQLERILTLDDNLKISRYVGKRLNTLEKIEVGDEKNEKNGN